MALDIFVPLEAEIEPITSLKYYLFSSVTFFNGVNLLAASSKIINYNRSLAVKKLRIIFKVYRTIKILIPYMLPLLSIKQI